MVAGEKPRNWPNSSDRSQQMWLIPSQRNTKNIGALKATMGSVASRANYSNYKNWKIKMGAAKISWVWVEKKNIRDARNWEEHISNLTRMAIERKANLGAVQSEIKRLESRMVEDKKWADQRCWKSNKRKRTKQMG